MTKQPQLKINQMQKSETFSSSERQIHFRICKVQQNYLKWHFFPEKTMDDAK